MVLAGLLMVAALQTTPPVATASQAFGVDYLDADFTSAGVTLFGVKVYSGAWVDVAPAKVTNPLTPAGSSTYRIAIPPLTPGAHSAVFRACNPNLCSDPSAPFAFVLAVKPATPPPGRIIGGL